MKIKCCKSYIGKVLSGAIPTESNVYEGNMLQTYDLSWQGENPGDNQTLYFSQIGLPYQTVNDHFARFQQEQNQESRFIYTQWYIRGSKGSAEEVTISLEEDGVDIGFIAQGMDFQQLSGIVESSVQYTFTPGSEYVFRLDTPAWALNPIDVFVTISIYSKEI